MWLAASVATLAVAVALAWELFRPWGGGPPRVEVVRVRTLVSRTTAAVGNAVAAGVSALGSQLDLVGPVSAAEPLSVVEKTPPPGVSLAELPVLEILASETGAVVSARFRTPPRGVLDSMLVSAGKAWVFQPAMRDGKRVPYRTLVVITLK